MKFSWPRDSLRKAYAAWQALEIRQLAARQELEAQYLLLCREAQSIPGPAAPGPSAQPKTKGNLLKWLEAACQPLDPGLGTQDSRLFAAERFPGLLRSARHLLAPPLDPVTLAARRRLEKAFEVLGQGRFRRAPLAVRMEIKRYAVHVDSVCRRSAQLTARLRSAREMIGLFRRDPESGGPGACRLALISPEAAGLLSHLRRHRLAGRQAGRSCLAQSWRLRMATFQRWLELLHHALPSPTHRQIEQSLTALVEKAAAEQNPEVPELLARHRQLDPLTTLAAQEAARTIADLKRPKPD